MENETSDRRIAQHFKPKSLNCLDLEENQEDDLLMLHSKNWKRHTLFRTKSSKLDKKDHSKVLAINPVNIIGLNIPSYGGGVKNMWNESPTETPITTGDHKKYRIGGTQDIGDGKLEFLTFTDKLTFGMERTFQGGGLRIAQGSGPFLFTFKKAKVGKLKKSYVQIDGEYMCLEQPRFMKISQCDK